VRSVAGAATWKELNPYLSDSAGAAEWRVASAAAYKKDCVTVQEQQSGEWQVLLPIRRTVSLPW
jgi:hypothetical protein